MEKKTILFHWMDRQYKYAYNIEEAETEVTEAQQEGILRSRTFELDNASLTKEGRNKWIIVKPVLGTLKVGSKFASEIIFPISYYNQDLLTELLDKRDQGETVLLMAVCANRHFSSAVTNRYNAHIGAAIVLPDTHKVVAATHGFDANGFFSKSIPYEWPKF